MSVSKLHWEIAGPADAPVVVALHAIATNRALWAHQVPVWSASWRVLTIDLPGHGKSPAPDHALSLTEYADSVAQVLDTLGITRAAFVGLSFGGMVAQAFALKHPQRVSALVLAHTTARTAPAVREIWQRRLEQFEREGLESQVGQTLERWFTRAFATAAPLTVSWVGEQIRSTSQAGYSSAIKAIQSLDFLDQLSALTMPTLVLAGEADSAVPPAAAADIAGRITGAQFKVLANAAHMSNVEKASEFTELVGAFLGASLSAK